jgi:hypothetical protein
MTLVLDGNLRRAWPFCQPMTDRSSRSSTPAATTIIASIAAEVRNITSRLSNGDTQRPVAVREIERVLKQTDDKALQAAIRHAADQGWLRTSGNRVVSSVVITPDGARASHAPTLPTYAGRATQTPLSNRQRRRPRICDP